MCVHKSMNDVKRIKEKSQVVMIAGLLCSMRTIGGINTILNFSSLLLIVPISFPNVYWRAGHRCKAYPIVTRAGGVKANTGVIVGQLRLCFVGISVVQPVVWLEARLSRLC